VDTVQVIYNVFDQSPEDELFPAAQAADVGVIARVPLDEGALSGGFRQDTDFAEGDMRRAYFQGALRFCLSHPAVSTVIAGSADPAHIRDNAAASDLGVLDPTARIKLKSHTWPRNFYP
jgi:aryl-alcohol dehydrogenase-like predicted oxidoreductase